MKWSWILILFLVSCNSETEVEVPVIIVDNETDLLKVLDSTILLHVNKSMEKMGLVDILSIDSTISIDLKYATSDNFMGVQLYDTLTRLFLQKEVALKLSKSQHYLDSIYPGFSLHVYDGVRPRQVQQEMWEALDSIPVYRRGKFVSNPRNGSVHNFGAAVDLTLKDSIGNIVDMGAGYDDFREIAFPKFEAHFLKTGELTQKQYENRKLLRKVMKYGGFYNIPSEWWHFNAYSRVPASHKFQMLLTESGASIWFKIPYKMDSISDSSIKPDQDSIN